MCQLAKMIYQDLLYTFACLVYLQRRGARQRDTRVSADQSMANSAQVAARELGIGLFCMLKGGASRGGPSFLLPHPRRDSLILTPSPSSSLPHPHPHSLSSSLLPHLYSLTLIFTPSLITYPPIIPLPSSSPPHYHPHPCPSLSSSHHHTRIHTHTPSHTHPPHMYTITHAYIYTHTITHAYTHTHHHTHTLSLHSLVSSPVVQCGLSPEVVERH